MTDTDYVFQADDAKLIHDIIKEEWACPTIPIEKVGVFYSEDGLDPSTFDFHSDEKFIRIYADTIRNTPKGISFDSIQQTRYIAVNVKCIRRTDMIAISDELRRIFSRYRMCPGNSWDQLYFESYVPIYPSFNFHESSLALVLRNFCKWIPPMKLTYPV